MLLLRKAQDLDEGANALPISQQIGAALRENSMRVLDLFRDWDTDGDGELSFEEFAAWFTPTCKRIQQFRNKQSVMQKQKRAQKMQARASKDSMQVVQQVDTRW